MNNKIEIIAKNANDYFYFQSFTSSAVCENYDCGISEYNDFIVNDATRSMNDHIALTWLLTERATGKIAAYMSLIMDAIKLSFSEKELHHLNYPFRTIPAMKIAKLAVDNSFDADLENDEGIIVFYEKNGFLKNSELYNKSRKTISMRKDLYI
jgi:hypothetical protein